MKKRKYHNANKSISIIRYLFYAIFAVNIIGALYFYAGSNNPSTLVAVLVGLLGFILGVFLGGFFKIFARKSSATKTISELRNDKNEQERIAICYVIMFVFCFVFAGSLFVQKGIPLFAQNDNALRSTFGVGTFGRIRALVTWCPYCSISLFCLSIVNNKYKKVAWCSIILSLLLLAFYSFKGNLLWFVVMLYIVNTAMKGKIQLVKGIVYVGIVTVVMLIIFSIWLDVDYSVAYDYLIKRVTQDQVDGLDFIITQYIPSFGFMKGNHFISELRGTFFSVYEESFDIVLANLFYGKKVTWGIVQTLYGFLYIDFGYIGVFLGFTLMGIAIISIERELRNIEGKSIIQISMSIYWVYVLIKFLLVGNIFNELKGIALSAIMFNVIYTIFYSVMFNGGRIRRRIRQNNFTS